MSEEGSEKVLSKEEVAAFDASKGDTADITKLQETRNKGQEEITKKVLGKIINLMMAECEKTLGSFLRRKLLIKHKGTDIKKIFEYCGEGAEKRLYTIFDIKPNDLYGMVALPLPLVLQMVSLLYGGQPTKEEPGETAGKTGAIVAEKLAQICLDAFTLSAREYGGIDCNTVKTVTKPHLSSKINLDEPVYIVEMTLIMGEIESPIILMVMEQFLNEFISVNVHIVTEKHPENNSWRTIIEAQVADSVVTVQAILPAVQLKLSELVELKEGSTIPISDPTSVLISLNGLKLFRANVGQANAKRVAKILGEI